MKEEIVISGISGRFPQSDNLEEFWQNLISGIDMVTTNENRWPIGYLGLPERKGTLKADLTHFDASFFGILPSQAERVDPQIRQLLEVTFEAIVDAGVNPTSIRGSNVGVFVGASAHDTFEAWRKSPDLASGHDITGSACCMLANRISFAFDLRGPSFCIDTFCSSSLMALHQGMAAIRAGECEAAIIAGVNLLFNPMTSLQIQRVGVLSMDGKCKSFDASGDGFVRSEAIVAIMIQKSDLARRSYCTLVHSKTNTDGFKPLGVSYPSGPIQQKLMETTYAEANIDPKEVFYVEPHGTGTAAGDPQEVNAITNVFTKDRRIEDPLLIGSAKSNMGHAEPAAALCSLAKIVLSLRAGIIPANLYYVKPNPNIPGLLDGRVKVVTHNTKVGGELIGLNSTGLGGSNIHVIIKANKSRGLVAIGIGSPQIPVLIPYSGRTEDSVKLGLKKAASNNDSGFIGLLNKIGEHLIPQHPFRGYVVVEDKNSEQALMDVIEVPHADERLPLWFVFSGMGTLWRGMMEDLMEFPIFSESVQKSAEILKPFGLDLLDIMVNGEEEILDKYMGACFVAIGLGLISLLNALELKPDGFLGHSAGEILCSYLDGCISQEEALISYYHKDIAVLQCSGGAMVAIGLSWEEAIKRCPEGIYPACNNSVNNVTVSGSDDKIRAFVNELKLEGIFAREVSTGGIAYHSPYLKPIMPGLEANVRATAQSLKERSNKWISTSIPEDDWIKPETMRTGSADYVLNNIKSPVLFYNTLKHIPSNAVVLEVSAHSLFVSMLRKTLPSTAHVLGLIRKGKERNGIQFLSAIGKLYQFGFCPKISALYPEVKFPVPAETPMIAPLIRWDHSNSHPLPDYLSIGGHLGETSVEISLENDSDAFLSGHLIDGRNIFPATGYLVLVWKKFASLHGCIWEKFPVQFENVRFEIAAMIPESGGVKFEIHVDKQTGDFEITEAKSSLVTGQIQPYAKMSVESRHFSDIPDSKLLSLSTDDVYKELRLQGYEYDGLFKGIKTADNEGKWSRIAWHGNWVTFLDALMQFSILSKTTKGLYLPTRIQRLSIDPIAFGEFLENNSGLQTEGLFVRYLKEIESIKCHGIQLNGLKTSRIQRRTKLQVSPILEEVRFVPYMNTVLLTKENSIKYMMDLVIENTPGVQLKIQERITSLQKSISNLIFNSVQSQPLKQAEITIISDDLEDNENKKLLEDIGCTFVPSQKFLNPTVPIYNLIILTNESELNNEILESIKDGGFVLLHSNKPFEGNELLDTKYFLKEVIVAEFDDQSWKLYRKLSANCLLEPEIIQIENGNCNTWLPKVQDAMKASASNPHHPRIYLVSNYYPTSGIIGLVNCLRQEPGGYKIRCIFSTQEFNLDSNILKNDLTMNVIDNQGNTGSYRHFPLPLENLKTKPVRNAFVNIETVGDLSSLKFIEAPGSPEDSNLTHLPDDKQQCEIFYSSLNFRDVMLATGKLPQDSLPGKLATDECVLGLEFAGRDQNGNRLMGMVEGCGMATHVVADSDFVWKLPKNWTMEDGATVPVAYSTAYYALIIRGRMRSGETVLIHSGSGAVGQAAISIALSMKCKVFTTVGSDEKKQYLKDKFGQLKDSGISNSRDTSFEDHIIYQTHGQGVDLILNSLSEEKLQASLRCLAEGGRFLEIGKFDLSRNNALGMEIFLKNITFHGILLDSLFGKNSPEKLEVVELVKNGIDSGVVKPLKRTIFGNDQIEDAFRFMASGKHIGKVLLKIKDEVAGPQPTWINAVVRTYFDPTKVYIIVGGLGGFGLELAGWMIQRGAKNLALVSRTGVKNGYQALQIRRWIDDGVRISVVHSDVTNLAGVEELISTTKINGAIGGIFNLAMVLKDGEISEQTVENFEAVIRPKLDATRWLDIVSRQLCPELDHFVVFSSATSGRGNSGQTNYGFANSAMERICEQRKLENLPALAIQWGAIGDVGVVQDLLGSAAGNKVTLVGGTLPQRLSSCLEVLDIFLRNQHLTVVSSLVLPKEIARSDSSEKPSLLDSVTRVLGLKKGFKPTNQYSSLGEWGIDSLTVVELKQLLERSCDKTFSNSEIRELTWVKLETLDLK